MATQTGKNAGKNKGLQRQAGKTVQVFTRLEPKDAKRLRQAAAADDRTVMSYIRRVLVNHLDEIDSKE